MLRGGARGPIGERRGKDRTDGDRWSGVGENIMFPTARGVVYFTIWRAI